MAKLLISSLRFSSTLLILAFLYGCPPESIRGTTDELGCIPPNTEIGYTIAELHLASLNVPNFTLGKLDVSSKPQVFEALEKTSRSELAREYIICRAQKSNVVSTGKQVEYLRSKLQFTATNPNADQYLTWENRHPFPPQD